MALDTGSMPGACTRHSSSFIARNGRVTSISNICLVCLLQWQSHSVDVVGCQLSISGLASKDACLVVGDADGVM